MFGYIILTVVIIFVVFLLCRELMCWYFKINKITALLEEQNALLRIFVKGSDVPNEIQNVSDDEEKTNREHYRALREIDIREHPNMTSNSFFKIQYNDSITLIKKGEKTAENNYWVYVENDKGMKGWCHSEFLEKTE